MLLDLRNVIYVPGASVEFDCELSDEGLDFPSVSSYQQMPHAHGRVFNEAGVLRLTGEVEADMICICDRCGEEFKSRKVTGVDVILTTDAQVDDPELFPLEGDVVDLNKVLSTCFILDMETKFLCREDCKGLCQTCGKNLNFGPCACRRQIDPRFAVLEQLLDKKI